MSGRPVLGALAERAAIAGSYWPAGGGPERTIADETRVALLAALGLDASSEAAAGRALEALEARERERAVPACAQVEAGSGRVLVLPLAPGVKLGAAPQVELHEEGGARRELEARVAGDGERGRLELELPELEAGYHRLGLRGEGLAEAQTWLLAAPARCPQPRERLGERAALGLWVNLYALRRERGGLGIGDLGALRELIEWVGAAGGDFVGLSPLHAIGGASDASPYSPQSRWFRSPLYLELEAVPELAESEAARALLADAELARGEELHAARWLDYGRLEALQGSLLEALHRPFAERHAGADTPRGRAYAEYCAEQGPRLRAFAAFRALTRWFEASGAGRDWRRWPAAYRDPRGAAVAEFAAAHASELELHAYVQFELDRQLAQRAADARAAGLRLGLYSDLALGSAPSGFDTWHDPPLFAAGVSVGAPADPLGPEGQDWGFPPLAPAALAERGFADWAQLVRANLRHAGALRIDHILGCMRQWWIPSGFSAAQGAYVRYPLRELLAVLAIESRRAGALVIGEDLGTVPEGLEAELAARGVLSLRVLLFERERGGEFCPARRYSPRALACANTHDLPTLAAFWTGRDLELRRELGLAAGESAAAEQREREYARAALLARLREEGLLDAQREPELAELVRAVHRFLCRSPAPLVALALGDLTGELEPVNLPGVAPQRYPSWSRRMDTAVESLPDSAATQQLTELADERRRAPPNQ